MTRPVTCGHCGAPLPPEAVNVPMTCAYCGTTSTPGPRVVEKMVERVVVVAAVGGAVAAVVHCPRCGQAFAEGQQGEHRILACQACGGAFLEKPAVAALEKQKDDALIRAVLRTQRLLMPFALDRRPQLSCPHCRTPLVRKELGETGHAVDICDAHGIFFDRGEVLAFAEFLATRRADDS